MNDILVSISCITYNHARYIRQCLDGFVMQKTDFPFEILIHDDASTDGTEEIIREYEKRYPDIIKPVYEEENQWVKGRRGSPVFNFPRAKGKYIALCEGDDYWTNPGKLQQQVDFLESHPDFSLCFHKVGIVLEDGLENAEGFNWLEEREYLLREIILKWTVPTCSALFRREMLDKIPVNPKFQYGDNVLFFTCGLHGRLHCLGTSMGAYRRHEGGWTNNKSAEELIKQLITHLKALKESFPRKLHGFFNMALAKLYVRMIRTYRSVNSSRYLCCIMSALWECPREFLGEIAGSTRIKWLKTLTGLFTPKSPEDAKPEP